MKSPNELFGFIKEIVHSTFATSDIAVTHDWEAFLKPYMDPIGIKKYCREADTQHAWHIYRREGGQNPNNTVIEYKMFSSDGVTKIWPVAEGGLPGWGAGEYLFDAEEVQCQLWHPLPGEEQIVLLRGLPDGEPPLAPQADATVVEQFSADIAAIREGMKPGGRLAVHFTDQHRQDYADLAAKAARWKRGDFTAEERCGGPVANMLQRREAGRQYGELELEHLN